MAEPAAWEPLGPPIGLEIGTEHLSSGPVHGRAVRAASHLVGPPGYLQGGLCAGTLLAAARRFDAVDAPVTSVDIRLRAPTPVGQRLSVVDHRIGAGEHDLELLHGETTLVEGQVLLTGHELAARAYDLAELATVRLPRPEPQESFAHCWVCGHANERGLQLLPAWHRDGVIVEGWIPDEACDDGRGAVDPTLLAAVLDCPTLWANAHHLRATGYATALLAGYHLRFFHDAPVHEPLRVVAVADEPDGRKLRGRAAVVDEERVVYAVSSALWIAVDDVPAPHGT